MDTKTMTRLRPTDDSAAAIRTALDLIQAEREATQKRMEEQTERRTALLLTGTNGEIRAAEESVRDAELDLSRLTLMADALVPQLAEAVAREAEDTRAQQVRDAAAAAEKFNKWFATSYTAAAEQIRHGLELERAAIRKIEALRRSDGGIPTESPATHPRACWLRCAWLGFLTRLPAATAGQEPFWWPR